ncbi:hypothetical protein ACFO4E_08210 [Nocardiopsis mangrovi]|uniref:Uncharacterized protein n=1 Tax=Nocardiopsis mangrovi TaxID=1179818 RepID=A0ABV9DSF9_9ACTN
MNINYPKAAPMAGSIRLALIDDEDLVFDVDLSRSRWFELASDRDAAGCHAHPLDNERSALGAGS